MADQDIKQFIKEEGETTRRHFDVVAERIHHEIQLIINKTARIQKRWALQRVSRLEAEVGHQ